MSEDKSTTRKDAAAKRAAADPSKPTTERQDARTGQETRADGSAVPEDGTGHVAEPAVVTPSEDGKTESEIVEKHDIDPATVNHAGADGGYSTVDIGASSVRLVDLDDYTPPDQWVLDNYRELRTERDYSWAELAKAVEDNDPRLAEYLRQHGDEIDRKHDEK